MIGHKTLGRRQHHALPSEDFFCPQPEDNKMPSEEQGKRRFGRKLTKKKLPQRHSSVQFPERLRGGEDIHEDVAAPKTRAGQSMNQSVFSMIAAAGSKTDFHARFDEDESSDSGGERDVPNRNLAGTHNTSAEPQVAEEDSRAVTASSKKKSGHHRGILSEHKFTRALPRMHLRTQKEKNYMSRSTRLPSVGAPATGDSIMGSPTPRDAPVMSRMLEAQAQLSASTLGVEIPLLDELSPLEETNVPTSLALRLKTIFGYRNPEEVISGKHSIPVHKAMAYLL